MPRPLVARIDSAALRHNLAVTRRAAPRARLFAVIKANAYGHGLLRCAHALAAADGFALLEIDAAVRLRAAGFRHPILLLEGAFDPSEFEVAAAHDLTCVVHAREQVEMLRSLPASARLDVYLKINTGMNRLGIAPAAAAALIDALQSEPRVAALGLMTHFACADEARGIAEQFQTFCRSCEGRALPRSCANSAAVLRFPESHADCIRPGIMLYGGSPFADQPASSLGLQPVMTLASRIIGVQELGAGAAVGYGATFVAERPMRVGIVACGYADGYPRHAATGTPVLVDGVRSRTLGRVSMDLLCVDLTPTPHARVGTPVTLWGEGLSADEVAAAAGTISYELFCALAPRVPVLEV